MFAERYLQRNIIYPAFIRSQPSADLKIVVVIPCFREPDIIDTLDSLLACTQSNFSVETIVVINQSEEAGEQVKLFNEFTRQQIDDWKQKNERKNFSVYPIGPLSFPRKHAGAGLARKVGMDEAVQRFHQLGNAQGIIASLDADTLVDSNYFLSIEKQLESNPQWVGATIGFKHRIDSTQMSPKQIEGIYLYERYLHYYRNAVLYTGHPAALFTIGSAFCCRVGAYVKQGGMNRRQAGEDFYFLHKLLQIGTIGEIQSTCVYPLARLSDRVPFGTGPILQRWVDGLEDLSETWNFQVFSDLKELFDLVDQLYRIPKDELVVLLSNLSSPLQQFLADLDFSTLLEEVNANAGSIDSFRKRFFNTFDAFRILKYVHFAHWSHYSKQSLDEAERMHDEAVE